MVFQSNLGVEQVIGKLLDNQGDMALLERGISHVSLDDLAPPRPARQPRANLSLGDAGPDADRGELSPAHVDHVVAPADRPAPRAADQRRHAMKRLVSFRRRIEISIVVTELHIMLATRHNRHRRIVRPAHVPRVERRGRFELYPPPRARE